jgi:hypothetical protein
MKIKNVWNKIYNGVVVDFRPKHIREIDDKDAKYLLKNFPKRFKKYGIVDIAKNNVVDKVEEKEEVTIPVKTEGEGQLGIDSVEVSKKKKHRH